MSAPTNFWSNIIDLNNHVDKLVEKCLRAVESSQPISREIPFYASLEARFVGLPRTLGVQAGPNSDALEGNNIKRVPFTNFGSRVYVREIGFQPTVNLAPTSPSGQVITNINRRNTYDDNNGAYPINWRWNFYTSITQRQYADRRVLANAGGRMSQAGNRLAFRDPLIIEPMETFVFECELVNGGFSLPGPIINGTINAIISMGIAGYREGI